MEEAIFWIAYIVGSILVIFVGWIIYALTEKRYVCKECKEVIKTHSVVENCPFCFSEMEKGVKNG